MNDENNAFRDTERQKSEDFQRQMQELGFEHEDAAAVGAKHAAEQGQLVGLAGGAASAGAGGFGGYFASKLLSDKKSDQPTAEPQDTPETDANFGYFAGSGVEGS